MGTGSITKRGDSWMLKWELPKDPLTLKRRYGYKSIKSKTKGAAQAELNKILVSLEEGSYVQPTKLTVAEWCESWLKNMETQLTAKTMERTAEVTRLHIIGHLGEVPLQKLTAENITRLYATLRTSGSRSKVSNGGPPRGLAEKTISRVHIIFKQLLNAACRDNKLLRNPCEYVKSPKPSASTAWKNSGEKPAGVLIKALDRKQIATLLNGVRDHEIFPVVALAISTGARRGELLALAWTDIDFDTGTLSIDKALEQTREHGVRFKGPKNERSIRTIALDANTIAMLRDHRKNQAETALKLGVGLPGNALLFPHSPLEPAIPRNPDNFTSTFLRAVKRLGFTSLRFHDIRHSVATALLTSGLSPHIVAQRLGHTPAILMKVYAHVLPQAESQAASICGALLENPG